MLHVVVGGACTVSRTFSRTLITMRNATWLSGWASFYPYRLSATWPTRCVSPCSPLSYVLPRYTTVHLQVPYQLVHVPFCRPSPSWLV